MSNELILYHQIRLFCHWSETNVNWTQMLIFTFEFIGDVLDLFIFIHKQFIRKLYASGDERYLGYDQGPM